jgi:uncharacterized protein with GYD domain
VPTYISLLKWTQLGGKNVKEMRKGEIAFGKAAHKLGVKIITAYWTMGQYDGVLIFEAPNDETATAVVLSLSMSGGVTTQTMRAFDAEDMQQIMTMLG